MGNPARMDLCTSSNEALPDKTQIGSVGGIDRFSKYDPTSLSMALWRPTSSKIFDYFALGIKTATSMRTSRQIKYFLGSSNLVEAFRNYLQRYIDETSSRLLQTCIPSASSIVLLPQIPQAELTILGLQCTFGSNFEPLCNTQKLHHPQN